MSAKRRSTSAVVPAVLAAFLLGISGCDNDPAGPNGSGLTGGGTQFSRDITLAELQDALLAGATRLEIELVPGSLTAREVEIERAEELLHKEEIESRITDIDPAGTLTVELGGLEISFTSATRFRSEDEGELSETDFVQRVQDALAASGMPPVKAKRQPAAEPQDPDDATFVAEELRLDDEAKEPELEINVDEDNLLDPGADGCDASSLACLKVLGLVIALEEGVTKLKQELEDAAGAVKFEGIVSEVDLASSTVTLTDGTVIRIVEGTEIEHHSGDDEKLSSLDEVARALDNRLIVEAEGEGVIESSDGPTIVAIEVEFEIEDDAHDIPGAVEFEGKVATVDVAGRTFTLANDTQVKLTDDTVIKMDGDFLDLDAVEQAVLAGQDVRAEGHATVESVGPPAVLEALTVKFEVHD